MKSLILIFILIRKKMCYVYMESDVSFFVVVVILCYVCFFYKFSVSRIILDEFNNVDI